MGAETREVPKSRGRRATRRNKARETRDKNKSLFSRERENLGLSNDIYTRGIVVSANNNDLLKTMMRVGAHFCFV